MKLLKLNNVSPRALFLNDKTNNHKAIRYIEATSSDLTTKSENRSLITRTRNMWNYIKESLNYSK